MENFIKKITASLIVMIIMISEMSVLLDQGVAYAIDIINNANNQNIQFKSYFENNMNEATFNMDATDSKLFVEVDVGGEGYLKDGAISFENESFDIVADNLQNEYIQKIENNIITLKTIDKESSVLLELPIKMKSSERVTPDIFAREFKTKLSGTYVNANSKETQINEELNNKLSWSSTANSKTDIKIEKYVPFNSNKKYGVLLQIRANAKVEDNKLPVKNMNLKIDAPIVANKIPTNVKVLATRTLGTNGKADGIDFNEENWSYDNKTGVVNINVSNETKAEEDAKKANENGEEVGDTNVSGEEAENVSEESEATENTNIDNEEPRNISAEGEATEEVNENNVNAENVNADNEIAWNKNADDEYLISFMYEGKDIFDFVEKNGLNSKIKITTNVSVYNNVETNLEEKIAEGEIKLNKKVSDIVNFKLNLEEKKINKGQIYSNYEAEDKKEIEYNLEYSADIGYVDFFDYIEFRQDGYDKFVTKDNKEALTTVNGKNYTKNKNIKIDVDMFNKMLGEEGYIDILDERGNALGRIDKNTEIKNGVYVYELSNIDNNKLRMRTSKPLTEGKIVIDVTKIIDTDQDYSEKQMKSFNKLTSKLLGATSIIEQDQTVGAVLEEPVTKADIKFTTSNGNADLSTAIEHKNLELRIVLDTSSSSNQLFQNPTFKIKFPKVMQNIIFETPQIINSSDFKIKSQNIRTEEDGSYVYELELSGTQTEYTLNDALKGPNIIINMSSSVDKISPSLNEQITLTYTNEKANNIYEQKTEDGNGLATTPVNIIAPNGVISATGMSGYSNDADDTVFTTANETVSKMIGANEAKKTITMSGDVVNNYENDISGVKILGRFPFKGNKVIDEKDELGSTINATIKNNLKVSNIDAANVDIYYSTNGEATNDIENGQNGWTKSLSDIKTAKSYMIVLKNNMKKTEKIHFEYIVEVPENLEFNSSVYTMYKVYYTNLSEIAQMQETKKSAIVGVTTGEGPKLSVTLSSNIPENTNVQEGRIVELTATVKNEGQVDAKGVVLTAVAPSGTKHVEKNYGGMIYTINDDGPREFQIGTVGAGKTVTQKYEIMLNYGYPEGSKMFPKDLVNKAYVVESRLENPIYSNDYVLKMVDGFIQLNTIPDLAPGQVLKNGDKITFKTRITNIAEKTLNNVKISTDLPSGMNFTEGYFEKKGQRTSDEVKVNGSKIEAVLNTMEEDDQYTLTYEVEVDGFQGEFATELVATANGIDTQYSNKIVYDIGKVDVSIVQKSSSPEYVKEGEEIVYEFSIKNNGQNVITSIEFNDEIPDGLEYVKSVSGLKDGKMEEQSKENIYTENTYIYGLEPGKEYIINLTCKAKRMANQDTKEVINYGTITIEGASSIESNKIKNYIEYNPVAHGQTIEEGRYSISGSAWEDVNLNGQKDENEQVLPEIEVMLLDKKTNAIVKDVDTKTEKVAKTDSNGSYKFDNLTIGDYAVIFLYDAAMYNITEYRKSGVGDGLNSDALNVNLTLDGKTRKAGITDTIKIYGSNIRNIDIGLYVSEKFDLSLQKYVGKITLTTPTIGTKETVHNKQIAKVEVAGGNMGKASIVVEYKIIVKNEGAVSGYAKKIVDYLPKSLTFNSELNKDWYLGKDGNLYNSTLNDVEINPGEQQELKLILTKKITEGSIGVINNSAEIYECYNAQGLPDMDSTPANGVSSEDDISSADIVISLTTGKVITYTVISIIIIAMLGTGIYYIKTRVLQNKGKVK